MFGEQLPDYQVPNCTVPSSADGAALRAAALVRGAASVAPDLDRGARSASLAKPQTAELGSTRRSPVHGHLMGWLACLARRGRESRQRASSTRFDRHQWHGVRGRSGNAASLFQRALLCLYVV